MVKYNKLIWIILFIIFTVQLAVAVNIVEIIGDDDNQITVIYLKGQPYDLGYIHGSMLREQVTVLYDSILNAVSHYGAPYMLDLAYKQMEPYIPQAYKDEMQGLADGAGVNIKVVHRVHAIPDLSEMDCSFFAAWGDATVDDNLYQIRALDYATDWHLQEHPGILVCQPNSGRRFVNIGWTDFIGVVSGMNYDGIAVSEIGESFDKLHHTLAAEPMPFVLRDVLQYSDNLDQAVEIIRNAKRTSSFLYCVGDSEIPDARSFKTGPSFCEVYSDISSPNSFLKFANYSVTGEDHGESCVPSEFMLYQNYPNPFNAATQIEFGLPENFNASLIKPEDFGTTELSIIDLQGQRVCTLVKSTLPAGRYTFCWNGYNDLGQQVSSGLYFYKLMTGSYQQVRRMLLIR